MKILRTQLKEVCVIEPDIFTDSRGFFSETWNAKRYESHGISDRFIQDNLSFSKKNVLRGLHFQNPNPQAKLVSVVRGEIFDVAVDIRKGSPTFGQWVSERLSEENRLQLFIPMGFAHGLYVLSEEALVSYKCSDVYDSGSELTLLWNDSDLKIRWPAESPIVSDRDAKAFRLKDLEPRLPRYEG